MINLIPPKARKVVLHEYWIRVVSVWAILISLVAIVVSLLLVPSYVLLTTQLDALVLEGSKESEAGGTFADAEKSIQEANATILMLGNFEPPLTISRVIAEVNAVAGEGITLNAFQVAREEGNIKTIGVNGTASTRVALAAFSSALERSPLFELARVPISDLAEESDLPFAITVSLSPTVTHNSNE